MSRDDLINTNTGIVKAWPRTSPSIRPNAVMIVVSNPLDAMVYVAWKASGFPDQPRYRPGRRAGYRPLSQLPGRGTGRQRGRCAGPAAGRARRRHGAAAPLHIRRRHPHHPTGEKDALDEIINEPATAGRKSSACLKPAAPITPPPPPPCHGRIASSRTKNAFCPCAAYCDKEYGVGGYFVGVPVVLGTEGVERVLVEIDPAEAAMFNTSVSHVKDLVKVVKM